jgi:hypothetical protein
MSEVIGKRPPRSEQFQGQRQLSAKDIHQFVKKLIADGFHAARVFSIANGVTGVIHGATLRIHAIGQALAQAQDLNPKHAIKQADRFFSKPAISLTGFLKLWVPYVIGLCDDVYVALDWTEFEVDDHCTIALYLLTSHGRATPLL